MKIKKKMSLQALRALNVQGLHDIVASLLARS